MPFARAAFGGASLKRLTPTSATPPFSWACSAFKVRKEFYVTHTQELHPCCNAAWVQSRHFYTYTARIFTIPTQFVENRVSPTSLRVLYGKWTRRHHMYTRAPSWDNTAFLFETQMEPRGVEFRFCPSWPRKSKFDCFRASTAPFNPIRWFVACDKSLGVNAGGCRNTV